MSVNALFARVKRAAPASLVLASFLLGTTALAQLAHPSRPAKPATAAISTS